MSSYSFHNTAAKDLSARGKTPAVHAVESERVRFMKKVYALLLSSSLAGVGGGVVGVLNFEAIAKWYIVLIILEFAMIFFTMAVRKVSTINTMALYTFAFISGLTLAPLLVLAMQMLGEKQGMLLIGEALGLTAAVFIGLSVYVFTTKKDFSWMGGMLFIGIFILLGAMIIGFFVGGLTYHLAISVGGVLLFAGFILYDTSMIMKYYATDEHVMAALGLYIDVLNLFVFLLRILLLIASSRD